MPLPGPPGANTGACAHGEGWGPPGWVAMRGTPLFGGNTQEKGERAGSRPPSLPAVGDSCDTAAAPGEEQEAAKGAVESQRSGFKGHQGSPDPGCLGQSPA